MGLLDWLFGTPPKQTHVHFPPSKAAPPKLVTGKFGQARHKPAGDWVQTTTVMDIVGITHRRDNVLEFCAAVQQAERSGQVYGVELEPDPSNANDRNAIKVLGKVGHQRWHIGFINREDAEEINNDLLRKGLEIDAELYSLWVGDNGYMEVRIIVLAPPGHSMSSRMRDKSK